MVLASSVSLLYDVSMLSPDALDFFRECGSRGGKIGGKIGGKAKVRKGFACMPPEKRLLAMAKSLATRRARKKSKKA